MNRKNLNRRMMFVTTAQAVGLGMAALSLAITPVHAQTTRGTRATTGSTTLTQTQPRVTTDPFQLAIDTGILTKIVSSSAMSLRSYPTSSQLQGVDPKIVTLLERGRKLLEAGRSASTFTAAQLKDYAGQVDLYQKEVMALKSTGDTTGTGQTCVTKCLDEYNQCKRENSCEYSIICLCCIPCSIQYSGCVAKCAWPGASGGPAIQ